MARFLFTVWPFSGHINPCMAVALALKDLGHEVAFYSGGVLRDVVERQGCRLFPFQRVAKRLAEFAGTNAPGDSEELYSAVSNCYSAVGEPGRMRAQRARSLFREMTAGTITDQVRDLEEILQTWQPDAVVTDAMMWGPIVVLHDTVRLPVAVFCFYGGCLIPGDGLPPPGSGISFGRDWRSRVVIRCARAVSHAFSRPVRAQVNSIRSEFGLGALNKPVMEYSGTMPLYLVSSVPEFDFCRTDLPSSVRYVGPCLWDTAGDSGPAPWVSTLTGDPPIVYVSEGTAQVRSPVLLLAAMEGLADVRAQVIVTTGLHRKIEFGSLPANVRVEQWVRHSDLFRKAAVVVTNGGSSTVRQALQLGVPLVVAPMEWDQFENAHRVADAGAGINLGSGERTPARIRDAVVSVLEQPSFRENARRLESLFSRYGQAQSAAKLIAGLAPATSLESHRHSI